MMMATPTQDPGDRLLYIGFADPADRLHANWHIDDAEVVAQDDIARSMFSLTLACIHEMVVVLHTTHVTFCSHC